MSGDSSRLIKSLAELAAGNPLQEKVLLAPSRRIGVQWLDAVARSGRPVLNFRVNTLVGLALEVASPLMAARGLALASRARRRALADEALAELAGSRRGDGYLTRLSPGQSLTDTLARTIRDLRMAGLTAAAIEPSDFEVAAKGREVKLLLGSYERSLEASRLVDHAGAFRLAAERLSSERLLEGVIIAVPGDLAGRFTGLEELLWNSLPAGSRAVLQPDEPHQLPDGDAADSALLSFVGAPTDAPSPSGDGTVEIFRAAGEVNEVREVLRRCVERGIPFDQVEIIHTDAETYVPLIYETCCELSLDPAAAPVTFYDGLPVSYSRPARALAGWLSWISEGFPQSLLVEMLSDGLLRLRPDTEQEQEVPRAPGLSFTRLAAILRAVPVGAGAERYLELLDPEILALRGRLEAGEISLAEEDEEEETSAERRAERAARLRERVSGLETIRSLVAGLLDTVPTPGGDSTLVLRCAEAFLAQLSGGRDEFDNYCRKKLLEDIAEMAACLSGSDAQGFDPFSWLAALARGTRLMGEGPRPGCLYVTGVGAGGHSGRPHTFLIGLDDGRFPGAGRQDPLLLDGERARVSAELETGSGKLSMQLDDFYRLMSRLRGHVTLSYPCRDLLEDREKFPSPVLIAAYRIIDRRDGDQGDLARFAGDPASFAPVEPGRSISETEWWLARTFAGGRLTDLRESVAGRFPNLARGIAAREARRSDLFTEYDGWVPDVGSECDPACPEGPVLSASRLETLAKCPQEYFFKYVLGIEPPEEYEFDPNVWLDRLQLGELLHSTFRRFMFELTARGLRPDYGRDLPLLLRLLDDEIAAWRRRRPPGARAVFDGDFRELRQVARIFLREEQEHCMTRRPEYFEVSVGSGPEGEGCPLDCAEPVRVALSDSVTVRLRGRIDRIDSLEVDGNPAFEIWDYKTGGTYGFDREDPLAGGRRLQGAVYLELASARLADEFPGARVTAFGYFFPGASAFGERFLWPATELQEPAREIILRLCAMAAAGCFPFTDDWKSDVKYSDYLPAFGDPARAQEDVRRKLGNPANETLRIFMELRGYPVMSSEAQP